jgi:hypothetical protein
MPWIHHSLHLAEKGVDVLLDCYPTHSKSYLARVSHGPVSSGNNLVNRRMKLAVQFLTPLFYQGQVGCG